MPTLPISEEETNQLLTDNEVVVSADNSTLTFSDLNEAYTNLLRQEAQNFVEKSLADLQESWPVILILLAVAAVVSFLWIFLMRWIAAPMIWIFILGVLALMAYGIYFCYDKYNILSQQPGEVQDISTLLQEYTFDFAQYLEVKEVWLGFLIALSIVAAIYVLLLIFFIKRIRIATRLLAEASKVSTFLKMGSELLKKSGYNFFLSNYFQLRFFHLMNRL